MWAVDKLAVGNFVVGAVGHPPSLLTCRRRLNRALRYTRRVSDISDNIVQHDYEYSASNLFERRGLKLQRLSERSRVLNLLYITERPVRCLVRPITSSEQHA